MEDGSHGLFGEITLAFPRKGWRKPQKKFIQDNW
jgi:hypothetical protein